MGKYDKIRVNIKIYDQIMVNISQMKLMCRVKEKKIYGVIWLKMGKYGQIIIFERRLNMFFCTFKRTYILVQLGFWVHQPALPPPPKKKTTMQYVQGRWVYRPHLYWPCHDVLYIILPDSVPDLQTPPSNTKAHRGILVFSNTFSMFYHRS